MICAMVLGMFTRQWAETSIYLLRPCGNLRKLYNKYLPWLTSNAPPGERWYLMVRTKMEAGSSATLLCDPSATTSY